MSDSADPRCPECGGPIGQTATYCMHCSADLTEERETADTDEDGVWDLHGGTRPRRGTRSAAAHLQTVAEVLGIAPSRTGEGTGHVLDPEGLVDDTLTVVVGILGGIVVGIVGSFVLAALTGSGWALLFGIVTWLGATAYLVRRRTVQGAIAHGAYAVAIVLLSVPLIALSPAVAVDGGIPERGGMFVGLVLLVLVPAGLAIAVGWIASRFVPPDTGSGTQ